MKTGVTIADYLSFRQKEMVAKIIRLRQANGLSQQELAEVLGCSRSRIARIETGRGEYTLSELEVLALRFGEDPLTFLALTNSERALLTYAYAHSVSYPALGEVIQCAHPAAGAVKKPIDLLAWSPDSGFLAAPVTQRGDDEATILCVWDAASGKIETEIHLDDYVSALAFSPDGRSIAVAGSMDTVEVWHWPSKTVVATLDPVDSGIYAEDGMWEFVHSAGYGLITQVEFSPDGSLLAVRNEDHGAIRLWDTEIWTRLNTLSIYAMLEQVELKRAQLMLGRAWQIGRNEAEDPYLYGSWSEPFFFTPDSSLLALLDRTGKRLDFFSLTGEYGWSVGFVRQPMAVDMIGLNQDGSLALVAAGGEDHLFEIWHQRGPYEHGFLYSNLEELPTPESTIKQLRIINAQCVLGLVMKGVPIDDRHWFVVNLVSNQPIPLLDLDPSLVIGTDDIKLAPNGRAVAYQDVHKQLRIQQIRPEHLVSSDKTTSLKIRFPRLSRDIPGHLREFFEEERLGPEDQADLPAVSADTESKPEVLETYEVLDPPRPQNEVRTPVDEVVIWLIRVISLRRPLMPERFGLASLPPDDTTTVQTLVDIIERRISKEGQVCLVELPSRGPRVDARLLLGYVAGRRLGQEEMTETVLAKLEGQYEIIIIDAAERLHHEAMIGICDQLQDLPAKTFLLITRNEEAFIREADRIRAGSRWLLERAVVSDCLLQLSQHGPVELDEETDTGEVVYYTWPKTGAKRLLDDEDYQAMSRFELHLYSLKTATPAAEGGYGLAYLPSYDRTTLRSFVDKVKRQTSDKIALVELPASGPWARLRQIVQGIVGRPLARGELTDTVLHQEVWRKYNIIVIDKAERLHPDTLGWICSHMRDIADTFLLVVREPAGFENEVIGKTSSPGWAFGRAVNVDLLEWLTDD